MSLAFRILYAAFGKGSHHKLALDATGQLAGADAAAWQNLFLAHAGRFVEGAKAPDDTFKDFTNHVLHPRDKFWGGAPAAATQWYGKTVSAFASKEWATGVYSAGVLSHYIADPLMPFHTAQSVAENNIHRAAEWSINRAYDGLRQEGLARTPLQTIETGSGPTWLTELVRASASRSNADYERLIAHYDITRGVVDPPTGLDPVGRRIAGDLLVLAAATIARVLDRAIAEAAVPPPRVNLVLPAILGTLAIPKAMVLKRLGDAQERKLVEAMYDELMATGVVEQHLPADDRLVKERHAAEVLGRVPATTPQPVSAPPPAAASPSVPSIPLTEASNKVLPIAATPAPVHAPALPAAKLTLTDDIEAAPSIGPKTAERFAAAGIKTVADLLACEPDAAARALGHGGMDAETIRLWQQQARLVLDIPGLNGTQSRLLTGAGYLTPHDVAAADVNALCAALLRYAASGAGQQVLRANPTPNADQIAAWVVAAKAAA